MILIGFMGSGKTTIAKRLHKKGYSIVDTDRWIEEHVGTTIPDIFENDGELHFRTLEFDALESVVGNYDVISTGGGIITYEPSYRFLADTDEPIIYLDAPIERLLKRISGDKTRPLAQERASVIERYQLRAHLYETLADIRIDTSQPISNCVAEIEAFINQS